MKSKMSYSTELSLMSLANQLVQAYQNMEINLQNGYDKIEHLKNFLENLSYIQVKNVNPICKNRKTRLNELLETISQPIDQWIVNQDIKGTSEDRLWSIEDLNEDSGPLGCPTEYCIFLRNEFRKLTEDGDQAIIKEIRDDLREKGGKENQKLYVEFRRFIIENPVISAIGQEFNDLRRLLNKNHLDFYERISLFQQYNGYFLICPECGYPLSLNSSNKKWNCFSPWCRNLDVMFRYGADPLDILTHEKYEFPKQLNVLNYVQLRRDIWQFTTIPGLLEIELYNWAEENDISVELWPEFDNMDLKFISKDNKGCEVDVKYWLSPESLKNHLIEKEESLDEEKQYQEFEKIKIVIPDSQNYYIDEFNSSLRYHKVITASMLKKKLIEVFSK
jgi:hypothetical protein